MCRCDCGASSPAIAGAVANASVAEAAARQFLVAHLAMLAPGANASDFVLVRERSRAAVTSAASASRSTPMAMRVLGGAIGVTFKRDRIVMVSSTALPNVVGVAPAQPLASAALAASAPSAGSRATDTP